MTLIITMFFFLSLNVQASDDETFFSVIGRRLSIPEHVLTFSMICFLLVAMGYYYRRKLRMIKIAAIPDKKVTVRNIFEAMGEYFYQLCITIIGEKDGPRFFPLAFSLFLVLLFSNLIGLVPGFNPPTEEMSTTFALGIFSFVLYNAIGIRVMGLFNYLKHLAGPIWYMAIIIFPLELISHIARPLTLGMRLKGNMLGDHTLIAIVRHFFPLLVPIFPMALGFFTSIIQAYVFTLLTLVYISMVLANNEHQSQKSHRH